MMMVLARYGWEHCPDARVWDEESRLARRAADCGFDCPWSAEHHCSCDNGEKAIEDTPDDPTRTTHHSGFRRACVCLVSSPWTRRRQIPSDSYENAITASFHAGRVQALPAWTI